MTTDPQALLASVPLQGIDTRLGRVQFRAAGAGRAVTHVLLHGIGSASASWVGQLAAASGRADLRVVAWDAPGYGESAALATSAPDSGQYAERLWAWLDALGASGPVVLVGHSLGALMAAKAAVLAPQRVERLVLLAPARGYGDANEEERRTKLETRLASLHRVGPEGMAAARCAHMLSPGAAPELVEAVRATMAQIRVSGYEQAARMLAGGTLLRDLALLECPISVASGEADGITPPQACDQVALAARQPRISLGPVGHACALEAADAVNTLLGLK